MSSEVTISKVLLNIARVAGKFLLIVIQVIIEASSERKKPICGVAEAYERCENGTITPDEFYNATKRR